MFRKGALDDCKIIYNLICEMECKQLPFDKFFNIYKKQVNDKYYYCLVCERDDEVVGVLNLRFEEQLHHSEYIAEIMEFVIDPNYREKGIGKEMLAMACKIAKQFGCSQIEVASNQLRLDAHRFYLRECMQNSHFKFSKPLVGLSGSKNEIGR